jgi:uncharacterized protein
LTEFVPFFRQPHLATMAGNFWARSWPEERWPTTARLYATAPGTQVLVHENAPTGRPLGDVVMLHGLEGSSAGGYMVSMAQALLEQGFRVHRLNMRGCGDTEHLTDTLYHAGLTQDARWLVEHLSGPVFTVGFSLGGNVVLKLAAELGRGSRLEGVVAVSTPLDLHECVRAMGRRENLLYEARFITRLRSRYKLRHRARPDRFPAEGLKGAWTVLDFDDRITAPHFGFGNASNYYATQSSLRYLEGIQVPGLLVQAQDDPLIPFHLFEQPEVTRHPKLKLLATGHGGHLGFVARRRPRFWLDPVVTQWLASLRNKVA